MPVGDSGTDEDTGSARPQGSAWCHHTEATRAQRGHVMPWQLAGPRGSGASPGQGRALVGRGHMGHGDDTGSASTWLHGTTMTTTATQKAGWETLAVLGDWETG